MKSDREIVSKLGALVRESADEEADVAADGAARSRFLAEVTGKRATSRAPVVSRWVATRWTASRWAASRWAAMGLAAAFAAGLALVLLFARPKRTIDFVVEGAPVASGGFVLAQPTAPATVRFSDGSELRLGPGSSGRVTERRERGARFSLERGEVHVHVTKREGGADYQLEAGPYSVKVTGTEFDLGWDPSAQKMHLVLLEGSVHVVGPETQDGVAVRAGQTLDVGGREGLHLSASTASSASAPSPSSPHAGPPDASGELPSTSPSAALSASPSSSSASPGGRESDPTPRKQSWAERVAAGDFEGVIAEAEGRGIDATLGSASVGDLMALADAARYGGKGSVASQSLKAVRSRFAGTKAASTSAFLLGRMAEDAGNTSSALSLYETCMAEGSTFSSEALGRRMLLVKRTRGDDAARLLADQYLTSYPKGPYADAARALSKR